MVTNTEDDEDSQEDSINYKVQYRNLKRKLKFLIYENECFQETLRSTQRRLLKASRDRSFLLDRLLALEKVEATSSEGEETESSDDGDVIRSDSKRKKLDVGMSMCGSSSVNSGCSSKPATVKKKKPVAPKVARVLQQNSAACSTSSSTNTTNVASQIQQVVTVGMGVAVTDAHIMTDQDDQMEIHPHGRHRFLDMDKPPSSAATTDIFSNDPSLDSESNEICEMETSPGNLGEDCLSVGDIIPIPPE